MRSLNLIQWRGLKLKRRKDTTASAISIYVEDENCFKRKKSTMALVFDNVKANSKVRCSDFIVCDALKLDSGKESRGIYSGGF
ncbi:hypothetical protein Nepgr_015421 [Nepenthes gracilis]|uniref:Uncharacterized protein n=1 Tax=Nepenthes gracilis TaxID=150966 RepID=A0AAD3SL17_NEPGR|nr:hypothetical protein Nepgr_015421 [Nepenthes gracilis]